MDILEPNVDEKYFLSETATKRLMGYRDNTLTPLQQDKTTERGGAYVVEGQQQEQEVKQVAIPVLTPDRMEKRQNGRRFKDDGEPMFTLTAQDRHGVAVSADGIYLNVSQRFHRNPLPDTSRCLKAEQHDAGVVISEAACNQRTVTENLRIRKLTPLECWRLQGFTDEQFKKAEAVNSNSQLYKQAGNSVTVNVVYEIARRLK